MQTFFTGIVIGLLVSTSAFSNPHILVFCGELITGELPLAFYSTLAVLISAFVFFIWLPMWKIATNESIASRASEFVPEFSAMQHLRRRGSF